MYRVAIRSSDFEHPPYAYETLAEALADVESALSKHVFSKKGPGGTVWIQLGPGTSIRVMSDECIQKMRQRAQEARRNPLLAIGDSDASWKLVVQTGSTQLPPLDAASEEAAEALIASAIETGIFRHVIESEHDYLFVQTGPGTVYMGLPTESFVKQQRAAVEGAMRAAAQQGQGAAGAPRIIFPGSRN